MKPLTLTMQAFGPFAGKEVLHFDELGDNPLFLINGPTGSGKTSLLDAICLALYNTTTGNERQGNEMRCNQAEEDVLTFVEFDFELAGVAYRIRRVPEQERPAKRGAKPVTQKPTATLYRLGDDLTEESGALLVEAKVKEANEVIQDLTGLSGEQFRQVMVLPQGKFRNLLLADSKDREKIFGSLFSTSIYGRLEEALKEKARGVRQAVQGQRDQLKGILSTGGVDSFESLERSINEQTVRVNSSAADLKAATAAWSAADKAFVVATQLEQAFKQLGESRERAATLEAQAGAFADKRQQLAAANEAAALAPLLRMRELAVRGLQGAATAKQQADAHLARAETALTGTITALAIAQKSQPALEAARARLVELESFRAKSNALIDAIAAHTEALAAEKASDLLHGEAVEKEKNIAESIAEQEKALEERQQAKTALTSKAVELAQLKPLLKSRQQMAETAKELNGIRESLTETNAEAARLEQASDLAKTARNSVQLSWHRGQAALLAAELEAGQPCPVCGSEDHPRPAQAGDDSVSEEDVAHADQIYQEALSTVQKAHARCVSLSNDSKRLEGALVDLTVTLGELARRDVAEVEAEVAVREAEAAQLEALNSDIQKRTEALGTDKGRKVTATAELKAADTALQNAAVSVAQTGAAKTAAEAALPEDYRTAQALDLALERTTEEVARLETALRDAQARHNTGVTQKALAESALDRAVEDVAKSERAVSEAADDYAAALTKSSFNTEEECQRAAVSADGCAQLQQAIADHEEDCREVAAALKVREEQLEGKERQDLAALEEATSLALAEKERLDGICSSLTSALHTLEKVRQEYQTTSEAATLLEAEYAVVGTLADVANGQTGNKISLQRFVLGVLLDDVLVQATQRLRTMSAGRYQLVRKGERAKGGGASGLEMMVYDDHSGTERSVATLSGGESFLAALSLALGLSDVVQSYAGGIRLDTLFIDEGFGGLDPESLELAIRTLVDLQQAGRMVGVISHVSEMKEQMELRVDIEKGLKGSHLRVIAPGIMETATP